MKRSKLLLCTIALGLAVPGLGSAESLGGTLGLAPPGPCAEPRTSAVRGDPVYQTASGGPLEAPDFTIAGDPVHHFDPVDVAGEPPREAGPRPKPNQFPAPCTTPDAGCIDVLAGRGLVESPGQPGGLPGAGEN